MGRDFVPWHLGAWCVCHGCGHRGAALGGGRGRRAVPDTFDPNASITVITTTKLSGDQDWDSLRFY